MKIDYDYIKKICDIFLESKTECIDNIDRLIKDEEDKLLFHINIMAEKGLISDVDGNNSFTDLYAGMSSGYVFSTLRLTASGHDFASAMNKADVISTIKEKFKDEGLSVVIDVAKQIANKKAKELLGLPE